MEEKGVVRQILQGRKPRDKSAPQTSGTKHLPSKCRPIFFFLSGCSPSVSHSVYDSHHYFRLQVNQGGVCLSLSPLSINKTSFNFEEGCSSPNLQICKFFSKKAPSSCFNFQGEESKTKPHNSIFFCATLRRCTFFSAEVHLSSHNISFPPSSLLCQKLFSRVVIHLII